jgi:flagellar protein FlgJ
MNLPPFDLLTPGAVSARQAASERDELAARRAASEFEALLLRQFTAALNPPADDEEGDLFGSSATTLYRQMFSEQMAEVMARQGGIGMAELMMRQLSPTARPAEAEASGLGRALEMAKLISSQARGAAETDIPPVNPVTRQRGAAAEAGSLLNGQMPGNTDAEPGVMQLPVNGRISSDFGARRDPIHGQHRAHHGVDIAAPRGTPIEAAAPGVVIFAGSQGGYGRTVVIEHADGRRTRYAHAERLLVAEGEMVGAGQTIATVGASGRATGPHLHFEVIENGAAVDPRQAVANDFTLSRR